MTKRLKCTGLDPLPPPSEPLAAWPFPPRVATAVGHILQIHFVDIRDCLGQQQCSYLKCSLWKLWPIFWTVSEVLWITDVGRSLCYGDFVKDRVVQAGSQGLATEPMALPIAKSFIKHFQLDQTFDVKAKEISRCKSTKVLEQLSYCTSAISLTWSKQHGLSIVHD